MSKVTVRSVCPCGGEFRMEGQAEGVAAAQKLWDRRHDRCLKPKEGVYIPRHDEFVGGLVTKAADLLDKVPLPLLGGIAKDVLDDILKGKKDNEKRNQDQA